MTATFHDVCNRYGDEIDRLNHRPDGAILCYPVISADEDKMHRGSFQSLLGEDFAQRQDFSVEKHVDKDTCPCFIFHCEKDNFVPPANSMALAESLLKCNVSCELHIFQDGCHGGGMKENDPLAKAWPDLAANWIHKFDN